MEFYPSVLERGVRSERALKLAIAERYVQGVSTRKVTEVMKQLCGLEVSSTQVSRASQALDEELTDWRERPLGEMPYLLLDARYEKIRHGGSVVSCAVLVAVGITPDGRRSVLGLSVSLSEAEVHWRDFLASLQSRGLHGVQLIVSDSHTALRQLARRECRAYPGNDVSSIYSRTPASMSRAFQCGPKWRRDKSAHDFAAHNRFNEPATSRRQELFWHMSSIA